MLAASVLLTRSTPPARSQLGDMQGLLGVVLIMLDSLTSWRRPNSDRKYETQPLGNTALTFHGSKLLAMVESGYPYLVKACRGLLASVGLCRFGGKLDVPMTAHPKVDPGDGVLHAFCYMCALFHPRAARVERGT